MKQTLANLDISEKLKMSVWFVSFGCHLDQFRSNFLSLNLDVDLIFVLSLDLNFFQV